MNAIGKFSSEPWVGRLGWTLMHFLWQGLVIAAVYAAARATAKRASAQSRYLLACVGLAALVVAPVFTYVLLGSPAMASVEGPRAAPVSTFASGTTFPATAGESALAGMGAAFPAMWSERFMPWVVMLWFGGSLICWARLSGGWIAAARLRTQWARTAPPEWQQTLDRLRTRMHIGRRVRLIVSSLVEVPVVLGWFRPVILVPLGALTGLPAKHLEALLLHELAHVRRHDYLFNIVQSVAEALLFYHPAVWWISGHVRAERELCCDDIAVATTGDAFGYALALADCEACRPARARIALAANGGRLADRIARLLGQGRPKRRTFSAAGAASVVLLIASVCVLFGQSADRPRFEVASIKPTPEKARFASGLRPPRGGRLHASNLSVRMLIMSAYRLQNFQIVGGPAWANTDGFDIDATGDANASRDQFMVMLQSLLEERFQLKFHRETRELPVYALTAGRNGPKLPAPKEGGCFKPGDATPAGPPAPGSLPPCGSLFTRAAPAGWTMGGGDLAMSDLVQTLSLTLGRPVLDRTGITSRFDVHLEFTPDDATEGLIKGWGTVEGHSEAMAAAAAEGATNPRAAPSILVALPQQLGLRLESTKGPASVMVIDRVEKPSAN